MTRRISRMPASAAELLLFIVFMFGLVTIAAIVYSLAAGFIGALLGLSTAEITTHLFAAGCGVLFGAGYTLWKLEGTES